MKKLVLGLVALGLLGGDASAYVVLKNFGGNTQKWNTNNVGWTISTNVLNDVTLTQLQTALQGAMATWQAVGCATISFTNNGLSGADPGNGIHFSFRQNSWDPAVADALAFSSSETFQDGTIASNDVVFNGFTSEWSTSNVQVAGKNDIQGVATHEVGHSLGLDHSRTLDATMFFTGGSLELRTLDPDDIKGACFLYPSVPFDDGAACDACSTSSNCADGTCLDWGGGHSYCGQTCNGPSDCPEHFSCWNINGVATPQCLPDNDFCHPAGANVGLGEFCFSGENCATGLCLPIGGDAYCTQTCSGQSCGAGFTCVAEGVCLKAGTKPYGEACADNAECASASCIFFSFGGMCSVGCGPGQAACPNGNQCLQNIACVPPGERGIGAPCASPEQCGGTWCENNLCTQPCSLGCPLGTACSGGFCVGAEIGAACAPGSICPAGLECQRASASDPGACYRPCDPLLETGCEGGEVCSWRWNTINASIEGRCVAKNGGATAGQSCASQYCEADLVCRLMAAEPEPLCHRDCRLFSNNYGCENQQTCVSLDDDADPQRGICVANTDLTAPVADPGPPAQDVVVPPQDAGVDSGQTTMDAVIGPQPEVTAGDTGAPVDAGGVAQPGSGGGSGGCQGGPPGGGPSALLAGLALALAAARRQRRRAE